jgi:hypothetical protein
MGEARLNPGGKTFATAVRSIMVTTTVPVYIDCRPFKTGSGCVA